MLDAEPVSINTLANERRSPRLSVEIPVHRVLTEKFELIGRVNVGRRSLKPACRRDGVELHPEVASHAPSIDADVVSKVGLAQPGLT